MDGWSARLDLNPRDFKSSQLKRNDLLLKVELIKNSKKEGLLWSCWVLGEGMECESTPKEALIHFFYIH